MSTLWPTLQGVDHVSGVEHYQINEKFYDQGVGGPNLGINSIMCAPPIKTLVGVKLQSHNMFARIASRGSCSLISKKLVNDLGFWPWVQMHRNIITNKDGQGKRGVGLIFLEVEFPNSPFRRYHPFEVIDEDWGNICILGGDFLNEYNISFIESYQEGAQIFSDYAGIHEPVMMSVSAPRFAFAPKSVCRYYMRGWCKFGNKCRFDHPQCLGQTYLNNFHQTEPWPVYDETYGGGWGNIEQNVWQEGGDQWADQEYNNEYNYSWPYANPGYNETCYGGQENYIQTLYHERGADFHYDHEYDNSWSYCDPFGQMEF